MNSLARSVLTLIVYATGASLVSLSAQEGPAAPASSEEQAESDWDALRVVLASNASLTDPVGNRSSLEFATPRSRDELSAEDARHYRESRIMALRAQAAQLREFLEKYPRNQHAIEAQCEEAITLLRVAHLGDDQDKDRRDQLVTNIRRNESVPVRDRSRVAAFNDNLAVARQEGLSREQRLAAFEAVVRHLIAEFPAVPEGYESLLGMACSRSDEAVVRVAREIVDSAAPESVKREARILIYRYSLVGKSASELTVSLPELKAALEQQSGRPVLLYTWATWSPGSMALAKKFSDEAPAQIALIGLNLDLEVEAAKAAVEEVGIRGGQFFQARAMAGILTMHAPALVFVIDKDGVLVSVSGHRTPASVIERLVTP